MIPAIILTIENEDDRDFMTRLYLQYHNLMYKIIYDIVKNPWDTEDIMQEVLVKLIDKIPKLKDLKKQNFVSYIAVSCKNTSYNFLRNKKQEFILDEDIDQYPDNSDNLDNFFSNMDDIERLAIAWPLLDEKTKYLLTGKYILKKSAKELAADLKMPADNVRMALVRAKRKARKVMADTAINSHR